MLREDGMERYEPGTIDETVGGFQEAGPEEGEPYLGPAMDQIRKIKEQRNSSAVSEDNGERSRTSLGPAWDAIWEIKRQRGSLYQGDTSYVTLIDHASAITKPRFSQPPTRGMGYINETQEQHYGTKAQIPEGNLMVAVDKLVGAYGGSKKKPEPVYNN